MTINIRCGHCGRPYQPSANAYGGGNGPDPVTTCRAKGGGTCKVAAASYQRGLAEAGSAAAAWRAVMERIADAAKDDGCTPQQTARRLATEYSDENMDADVWAVFDTIATELEKQQ